MSRWIRGSSTIGAGLLVSAASYGLLGHFDRPSMASQEQGVRNCAVTAQLGRVGISISPLPDACKQYANHYISTSDISMDAPRTMSPGSVPIAYHFPDKDTFITNEDNKIRIQHIQNQIMHGLESAGLGFLAASAIAVALSRRPNEVAETA